MESLPPPSCPSAQMKRKKTHRETQEEFTAKIDAFRSLLKEESPTQLSVEEFGCQVIMWDKDPNYAEIVARHFSDLRYEFYLFLWVKMALDYIWFDDEEGIKKHLRYGPATLPKWAQGYLFPEEGVE